MTLDTPAPSVADRRPGRRRRTFFTGVVVHNNGADVFTCSIRNCSEGGACITVSRDGCPQYLFLIVVRDRIAHEAQVIWQDRREAGVKFIKSIELSDSMDLKLVYLNEIWHSHSLK